MFIYLFRLNTQQMKIFKKSVEIQIYHIKLGVT